MTDLPVTKPQPFLPKEGELATYYRGADVPATLKTLEEGQPVLITEFYNNGSVLLKELQRYLNKKLPNKTFKEQREYRAAYHKLSNLLIIEINDHQLAVKKAPRIGWFSKLYTETPDFLLTFPQVQGLNSAWQWYENGIAIPVLRNKIHPYYGVYFPTRF
ncbi:MAG: methyltransferase type 11, partial [Winogradskyella sp.]